MEKAVLKTLIYADIFDYPLKAWEIHKWLIGRKCDLLDIEKALGKLSKKGKVRTKFDFYFLPRREKIAAARLSRLKVSNEYFKKAKLVSQLFKIIPWIKIVGISGSLAMENVSLLDDIDLFIITSKNRLWISRVLMLGLLNLTGQRRKPNDTKRRAAGKICVNLILQEDLLEQKRKDLYTAHEILQMVPLWQRGGTYTKYLDANFWAFEHLPNWTTGDFSKMEKSLFEKINPISRLETLAKALQLNLMGRPKGNEKVGEKALYFHPEDKREEVLKNYRQKIKKLSTY